MDLKKEDEDYIYDSVNKGNKSIANSKGGDKYQKIDQIIMWFCPSVIILMIIIGILFSMMSGSISNSTVIFTIFIFLGVFSAVYLIWSFCFWIVGLISKKARDNHKFRFMTKLLTSIIVAILFTLTLFMPLCGDNCGGRNNTPLTNINQLLKTQIDNPGVERCTDSVTFTRNNPQLSAEGITKDTGLSSEQIYFDNPEDISVFNASNSKLLKYTATSSKKVVMCALCSNDKTNLQAAIYQNQKQEDIFSQIPSAIPDNQTACIVYPRKTT